MENFKYTLDKSSKKFICPNCNKKSLVLYIDTETDNYLVDDFGRCDRETNCGYHKAPPKERKYFLIPFLSLKNISDKAVQLTDINGFKFIIPKSQILEKPENGCWVSAWFLKNSIISYLGNQSKSINEGDLFLVNTVIKRDKPPDLVPSFHSLELLNEMYFEKPHIDNLTVFLAKHFSKDEVFEVMQTYFITGVSHFWERSTGFWQIDEKNKIHGCKVMLYDESTGKRVKKPYNHINWLHKAFKDSEFKLSQCLFGLHLINEDYEKTIAIVESEKTAIIMSILMSDFIWIATGSKQNLKFELLKPLKKRDVVLFPDKGEYSFWFEKATELNKIGFRISVSELIEQTNFGNGFDLVDYYLSL